MELRANATGATTDQSLCRSILAPTNISICLPYSARFDGFGGRGEPRRTRPATTIPALLVDFPLQLGLNAGPCRRVLGRGESREAHHRRCQLYRNHAERLPVAGRCHRRRNVPGRRPERLSQSAHLRCWRLPFRSVDRAPPSRRPWRRLLRMCPWTNSTLPIRSRPVVLQVIPRTATRVRPAHIAGGTEHSLPRYLTPCSSTCRLWVTSAPPAEAPSMPPEFIRP